MEKIIDGKKIVAYHGDARPLLEGLIECQKYDVVLSAHTHDALIERRGKTLHINPGTVCEYGHSKIKDNPTIAIYDTKKDEAEIILLK